MAGARTGKGGMSTEQVLSGHLGGPAAARSALSPWDKWRGSVVCVPKAQPCRDGIVGTFSASTPKDGFIAGQSLGNSSRVSAASTDLV